MCVRVRVGMHAHAHKSTFPPTWAMGHTRSLRRSWKVMDGHERSWSWSWTWACPCPYPWNRHTHMRVQTQRQALACKSEFQPGFCFKASHSQICVKNKLIIKDSSTPPTVMKIGMKAHYYQYFLNLTLFCQKKKFQTPPS